MIKASLTELSNLTSSYRCITSLHRRGRQLSYLSYLCHKYEDYPAKRVIDFHLKVIDVIGAEAISQVHTNKIISPAYRSIARAVCDEFGKTNKDIRTHFGFGKKEKFHTDDLLLKIFLEKATANSRGARDTNLKSRLADEVRIAHAHGWYVVFNTLTIADENMEDVFATGSMLFSRYIRRVTRSIGAALGYTKIYADEFHSNIHRYFAVVELGSTTSRRHIHILHLCKALPVGSLDPNARTGLPYRRQVDTFRAFWHHGFSAPLAVRYSFDDAFSKLGWRWPVEKTPQGSNPIKHCDIMAVCHYVAKYITKNSGVKLSWISQQVTLTMWRTRMTRQFGQQWITDRLEIHRVSSRQMFRALQESKARRVLLKPNTLSWSRLRSAILRVLANRRLLDRAFLMCTRAIPLCKRARLNPEKLMDLLKFPKRKFMSSRQLRIDTAIFNIISICNIDYFALPLTASFADSVI